MAHILVIEDDAALQEAYSFILKADGHKITSAYNGKEGLAYAEEKVFDVILLDIHMPIMDGWTFLKKYKKKRPPKTKIIVFSNMIEPETQKQAAELGAHRSVLKSSITPTGMLTLVKELLGS